MKSMTRRFVATLASTLVLCSSLAIPVTAHASHGVKCGFVLVSQNGSSYTYTWVCSRGV